MPLLSRNRLYITAAIILLAGLSSSVRIYLTAAADPTAGMVDEYLDSKSYSHELAVYGGKLTVLADDFYRWFGSLWHGRQLAFTVAFITVAISLGIFAVARLLPQIKGTDNQ